jgi:hypothetical protein
MTYDGGPGGNLMPGGEPQMARSQSRSRISDFKSVVSNTKLSLCRGFLPWQAWKPSAWVSSLKKIPEVSRRDTRRWTCLWLIVKVKASRAATDVRRLYSLACTATVYDEGLFFTTWQPSLVCCQLFVTESRIIVVSSTELSITKIHLSLITILSSAKATWAGTRYHSLRSLYRRNFETLVRLRSRLNEGSYPLAAFTLDSDSMRIPIPASEIDSDSDCTVILLSLGIWKKCLYIYIYI